MNVIEKSTNKWLTRRECLGLLECTLPSFVMMVDQGLIRRREVPGHRRYWREDVERLSLPPSAA